MIRFVALCVFLAGFSNLFSQEYILTKKEKKELTAVFEGLTSLAQVEMDQVQQEEGASLRSEDQLFEISQAGEVVGYLLQTSAKGRYDNFDYSVIFSSDLVVEGLLVTVYRSTHGAAICQKTWLNQFNGYAGQELTPGKDIDAISGATFSVQSLTKDMQRCHEALSKLKAFGIIK